jgi:chromate transporter
MVTPGPVVIAVVFVGYLAGGFLGAAMAAIGIFLPVYLFTIIPAPWFSRTERTFCSSAARSEGRSSA